VVPRRSITVHSRNLVLGLLISDLTVFAGCTEQPKARLVQLEFLQANKVSRASVDEHLGQPNASFIQDRVVTYRLSWTDQGYLVAPPRIANPQLPLDWQGITHDLVLAFDEAGMVSEYRLIEIHPPDASH
jgi:hypothetical protein